MNEIMHFPITITEVDKAMSTILPLIKRDWPIRDIQIQNIEGGFSCHMRRFFCRNNCNNAVTLRVRNLFEHCPLNDPQFELQVVKMLHNKQEFPRILATFNNGYIYDYAIGIPIITLPLRKVLSLDQYTLNCIADRLAVIHSLPINGLMTTAHFDRLRKLMNNSFQPVTNILPNKEELFRELDLIEGYVKKYIPPSTPVLTHGDFHVFNIIKLTDGSIKFFDWEFAHVNHRAHDIAFFFQVLISIGYANEVDISIPEDGEKIFIKAYLTAIDNTADFTSLYNEVQVYKLVVLITLMAMQSVYHDLTLKICKNPEKYHAQLLAEYISRKEDIFGKYSLEHR